MDVTVRKGTAEDAPALARLRWRWRTEEREEITDTDQTTFNDYFISWVLDHLATHLPFVVEVDGRLAGMAFLALGARVPSPSLPDRRTADIQSVYVVPELRDSGVGGQLIEALLAEARARELEHVTVHSSDRAVPFYQRVGFAYDGRWFALTPRWRHVDGDTRTGQVAQRLDAAPGRPGAFEVRQEVGRDPARRVRVPVQPYSAPAQSPARSSNRHRCTSASVSRYVSRWPADCWVSRRTAYNRRSRGRVVGPVHVLDHEHGGPAHGQLLQRRREHVLGAAVVGERGGERSTRVEDGVPQRPERTGCHQVIARGENQPGVPRGVGERPDHGRLPDARLAGDEHDGSPALLSSGDGRRENGEFGLPLQQRSRP